MASRLLPSGRVPRPVPYEIRAAVEELLARYALLIDAGDFAGIADLCADATITAEDGSVITRGRDGVLAMYESFTRRYDDGTPHTQHVITNLIVEADTVPDRFVARSSFLVLQATEGLALQPITAGRYRDVVERDGDGGVRFVERCLMPRLNGNLDHHLLLDIPE
jgi:hypothetical protein